MVTFDESNVKGKIKKKIDGYLRYFKPDPVRDFDRKV